MPFGCFGTTIPCAPHLICLYWQLFSRLYLIRSGHIKTSSLSSQSVCIYKYTAGQTERCPVAARRDSAFETTNGCARGGLAEKPFSTSFPYFNFNATTLRPQIHGDQADDDSLSWRRGMGWARDEKLADREQGGRPGCRGLLSSMSPIIILNDERYVTRWTWAEHFLSDKTDD